MKGVQSQGDGVAFFSGNRGLWLISTDHDISCLLFLKVLLENALRFDVQL